MTPIDCAVRSAKIDAKPREVSVNGVSIPREAIAREAQNHAAGTPIEAWKAAARALVVRELLLQEARRQNIEPLPLSDEEGRRETDDEAMIRMVVEQSCPAPAVDDEACKAYYDANMVRFRSAPLVEARHILIAAAPKDQEARREARALAERLITHLADKPHEFSALAQEHSACSSAASGGALGQISPGQAVPEFESALFMLPEGLAPVPVESRYGVHIVVVDALADGRQLPFDLVIERIRDYLATSAEHAVVQGFIQGLAVNAAVTGIELQVNP